MGIDEKLDLIINKLNQHDQKFESIDKRFESIDQKFDSMDQRFESIDQKFNSMDQRFETMNQKMGSMDQRYESIDQKFISMDQRFETMDQKLGSMDQRFESIDQKQDEHTQILNALIHGQTDLKANLDGFKLETCKHFEDVKAKQEQFCEMQNQFDAKLDLLEKRTWNNESDVYRLKKIVGIE